MKKAILATVILTLTAMRAQAVPKILNYQGFLTESGSPVTGTRDMTFRVFAAPTGGVALFAEVHAGVNTVTVSTGNFSVLVGELTAGGIPAAVFDGNDRYMETTVGVTVLPRQRIVSVAYSIRAEIASGLDSTGDILITPTGNVGIGTTAPAAKLDVGGAIEYLAKPLLRFTRAQVASSGSDAAKDAQCSAEFGPAYVAASVMEGITLIFGPDINTEPLLTFSGILDRCVIIDAGFGPAISDTSVVNQKFGPGSSFLACVQKTAPLRFTRTLGSAADSDALKDGRCSAEFGPNYMAATVLDVNGISAGPVGTASVPLSNFAVAGDQFQWARDPGGRLVEGFQLGRPSPTACIHK